MVIIESSLMFKIFLRQWLVINDDSQKLFAVLLADKLPDPMTPHDYLIASQQLASDLLNNAIKNSPLSGQTVTFMTTVYSWPVGQMTDDFATMLKQIALQ